MKKALGLLVVLAILGSFSTTFAASVDDEKGHVNIFIGQKALDNDEWEPMDSHTEVGIDGDMQLGSLPFNLSYGILASSDEATGSLFGAPVTLKGKTTELRLGARKYMDTQTEAFDWFVGGGLSNTTATVSINGLSATDSALGFFIELGAKYQVSNNVYLGSKIDYSIAEVDGLESGGLHYGLVLGYTFN